jgi:hypothetical protein
MFTFVSNSATSKPQIVLYHHLGLGDHFICNGLVNHLSEQKYIHLPCQDSYFDTIKALYRENMNVTVFKIFQEPTDIELYAQKNNLPVLKVGFENLWKDTTVWYRSFYAQYNIPYEYRYEKFKIPSNLPSANDLFDSLDLSGPYAVVHNASSASSQGYPINLILDSHIKKIIHIDPTVSKNMLDWLNVIQNAAEIHVVPSSVFCLVDSIAKTLKSKLYYHDIRLTDTPILHADISRPHTNWKIIKYDQQL